MNRGPPHQGKFPETEALNCSAWILTTAMMSSASPSSAAWSRDFRGNDLNPDLVSSTGLGWAHPIVGELFVNKFGTATEPQQQGWPHILAGKATLISAPTGSGKTLAAFLACIDRLVRKALAGELVDQTEVLYVSPLKALGNDIQRNLATPLGEILQLAGSPRPPRPEIPAAGRTRGTPAHARPPLRPPPP